MGVTVNGFKKFILRGNVVDLAVGVVIGAAFTTVVNALVTGFITPLTGIAGGTRFDQLTWCLRGECGVNGDGVATGPLIRYGSVLTALLNFLIVAAVVYFFVVRPVQALLDRFKTEPEVTTPTKECPECLSSIPMGATRCAYCAVEQPVG
jgi:large conductance mechanosensitive channel